MTVRAMILAEAANEWEANALRWANEVGLSEMQGEEISNYTSDVTVDGVDGQQLRLLDDQELERGTIAIMAKRGRSAWFIKLSGDRKLVAASEADFEQFINNFKFKSGPSS